MTTKQLEEKLYRTKFLSENFKLIKFLPFRLQELLKQRYGFYTLKEMGEEMDVTQERVRQLEEIAFDKLRGLVRADLKKKLKLKSK